MEDLSLSYKIARLNLSADDVLVVKYNGVMTLEIGQRLADMARETVPNNIKTMIIDDTVDVSVLTGAEIAARATSKS